MTTKKRIDQLERAVKANQPAQGATLESWKDFITRADNGEDVPGWDLFIKSATKLVEANSKGGEQ